MVTRFLAKLLLVLGLGGILVSTFMLLRKPGNDAPAKDVVRKPVMVSVIALRSGAYSGDMISENMLQTIAIDEKKKPVGAFEDTSRNRSTLNGEYLSHDLPASTILTTSDLLSSADSLSIAGRLAPGHVAVPIKIVSQTFSAALIQPNDYIDVLASFRFSPKNTEDQQAGFTSTWLLKGVRVLAVNGYLSGKDVKDLENRPELKDLLVEVTPLEARKISIASRVGEISIALRSTARMRNSRMTEKSSASVSSEFKNNEGEDIRLQDEFYKATKKRAIHVFAGSNPPKEYAW